MRITLKVDGAELVRSGLQNLSREIPQIGRDQIWRMMNRAKERMQVYPPERPGQRYVRTYRLKHGWQVVSLGATGYRLLNYVPYTIKVVGNAWGLGQAPIHVGRWQLVRDVMESEVKTLRQEVQDHVRMVVRRYFR